MVKSGHEPFELAWLRGAHKRRIGLFGGSFNPVHEGHWQCAEGLRKAWGLHQVWWLPTPQNPLKVGGEFTPFATRVAGVQQRLGRHPYHRLSLLMAQGDYGYTIDFLEFLHRQRASNSFYWLAGTDILSELHRWRGWMGLEKFCDFVFYSRPGHTLARTATPASQRLRSFPVVVGKRNPLSASHIRRESRPNT